MILSKILAKNLVSKTIIFKKLYKKSLDDFKIDSKNFLNKRNSFYLKKLFNKKQLNSKPLINYIININLSLTNTLICVTDTKGRILLSFSSGLVNLTKRQKKSQPLALITIFKVLITKAKFLKNKPVALHFKNTKSFYESIIIKTLKDKLFIKTVQSYNLTPHNGCRPKKLKRIKRRTKRMVLN